MQYSPKLRRIADDFRKVLEEEKVTCLMVLHDEKTQLTEYVQILDIPDNLVKMKDGKILITTKDISFKGTKKRRLEHTVNMVFGFFETTARWFLMLDEVKKQLESRFDIEVFRGGNFPKGHDNN